MQSLDGCRELAWMKAQILANFELHTVDLREKPRDRGSVVGWVSFHVPQVSYLSLKLRNAIEGDLELLVVADHVTPP
jgi:hypothetical protein